MADNPDIPEGLPRIEAPCPAADLVFGEGPAFWADLDENVARVGLEESLDRALAGRAAPRVWVLVHEPGHPQLAVAAALGFARALAARGQAALVLDGDDHATALSRWAGREDAEGWIDIVRYGTSVLSSGVALPFAGRTAYLLGVGTYAPTDALPEEIDHLLARLRRQADDVLVVLPGGTGASAWARRADIRLLCHDQADLSPPHLAAVVANLTAAGVAPTALVGFGRAAPMPAAADAPPGAPATAAAPADEPAERSEPSVTAALEALAGHEPAAMPAEPALDEYARRRGSSGVFWLVAAAATVLIALVGFYYVKFVRVTDGDLFAGAPTAAAERPAPPPAAVPDTGRSGAEAAADAPAATVPAGADADTAAAVADTAAVAARPAPAEPAPAPDRAAAEPPEVAQPTPSAGAEAAPPPVPAFDPAPYEQPVGAAGWALQVYSFRDSASAGKEMERLGRRGLWSAVRVVELPESGRWWRIYVGSFPSRQAARAAMPALFGKLGTDWAQPARFSVAATDTAGR